MKLPHAFATVTAILIATLLAIAPAAQAQTQPKQTQVKETVTTITEKTTVITEKEIEEKPAQRVVAIFSKNRGGKTFESKLGMFEDLLVGQITDLGFQVISPEDTAKALKTYPGTKDGKPIEPTALDKHLTDNSNALRLSQSLNADYLFTASITSFGQTQRHLKRPDLGIDRLITDYKLVISYKILDGNDGKSLSAGNISSAKRVGQSESLQTVSNNIINEMILEAVKSLAVKLEEKAVVENIKNVKLSEGNVFFTIQPNIQSFTVPEIKVTGGKYNIGEHTLPLQAINVTVELDGVVIGTAPGKLQASPGLHTISISHPNLKPFERTINIRKDMNLNIPMIMSGKAIQKFAAMTKFIANLKKNQQLTDAQAEQIRGYAQMLRQSGFRVDQKSDIKVDKKSDIKVDTKDAPTVVQNNIERQNAAQAVWPE